MRLRVQSARESDPSLLCALTLPRDQRGSNHTRDRSDRDRAMADLDCHPQAVILRRVNSLALCLHLIGVGNALDVLLVGNHLALYLLTIGIAPDVLDLADDLALYLLLGRREQKPRLEGLLRLVCGPADLFLRLPARLVDLALALEASIAGDLASGLLGAALRLVNLLCHLRLLLETVFPFPNPVPPRVASKRSCVGARARRACDWRFPCKADSRFSSEAPTSRVRWRDR